MNPVKLIVHDWDDVVINSFQAYSRYYFDFAEHFALPAPALENIKKFWGMTIPEIVRSQWQNLTPDQANDMVRDFISIQEQRGANPYEVTVFPGVIDAFKTLSARYDLAVLSSGYRPRLIDVYKKQINPDIAYHKAILAPPELAVTKPDPRVFDEVLAALKQQQLPNEAIVYVGDSLSDLKTAQNRGVAFYAITTGVNIADDFLSRGVEQNHILEKFSDLANIL